MGKRNVLLAIAFVAIAMVSGGIVSIYEMNKDSVEAKGAAQAEIVDTVQPTVQPENEETAQAEIQSAIQVDKIKFSCGVSGCTQTEVHQHGFCGIDGCTQIGKHSHGICSVAGCTEIEAHVHNGEYCYPHSADDGHAYHNCGVVGCTQTGEHSHVRDGDGHHQSGHGESHHQYGHGGGHH